MSIDFRCPRCAASIAAERVDMKRQIATCRACGSLVDLAPQFLAAAVAETQMDTSSRSGASHDAPPRPRQRPPVPLPAGMAIRKDSHGLVLTRRWLRTKHLVMLVTLSALTGGLIWAWQARGFEVWMAIAAFFLVGWDFMLMGMLVNSTTITVSDDTIDVRHGPLPSPLFTSRRLRVADVEQLFAAPFGSLFEVGAVLRDKSRVVLVRPLVTQEQALFVEQQIERRLALTDVEVAGELGSELPLPDAIEAAVKPTAGGAIAALPIAAAAGMLLFAFFFAFATEIEGTLQLSGPRTGDQVFTPTSCSSGQLSGFFGVELRAEDAPDVAIRLVRDPVQGDVIAIERAGQATFVVMPAECESMRLDIVRTNNSINDVWNVEGSASLDCPGLRGELKFAGCH
jgi:hypothetical protein